MEDCNTYMPFISSRQSGFGPTVRYPTICFFLSPLLPKMCFFFSLSVTAFNLRKSIAYCKRSRKYFIKELWIVALTITKKHMRSERIVIVMKCYLLEHIFQHALL